MPKYARKAREEYQLHANKQEFIQAVLVGIRKYDKGEGIAENATKAFLSLTKHNDCLWIEGRDILKQIGLKGYRQNQSYGLWPWLRKGARIIQEQGEWPETRYKVKDEFYETMVKVILDSQ
jgi:hypothetical protein